MLLSGGSGVFNSLLENVPKGETKINKGDPV
jgi:hypothetical protein